MRYLTPFFDIDLIDHSFDPVRQSDGRLKYGLVVVRHGLQRGMDKSRQFLEQMTVGNQVRASFFVEAFGFLGRLMESVLGGAYLVLDGLGFQPRFCFLEL